MAKAKRNFDEVSPWDSVNCGGQPTSEKGALFGMPALMNDTSSLPYLLMVSSTMRLLSASLPTSAATP
jgi:hypothetical protein